MITGTAALMMVSAIASAPCEPGAYRSPAGETVALSMRDGGESRYSFFDGRRGTLSSADSLIRCAGGSLVSSTGPEKDFSRVPLRITPASFESGGVLLAGELIEPTGAGPATPLVVMAHGSERTGWIGGRVAVPYLLAAKGISVFIFDKAGTGQSEGTFHMNFTRLARDVTAAAAQARGMAEGRHGSLGLHGFSQGGWVAPLAAQAVRPARSTASLSKPSRKPEASKAPVASVDFACLGEYLRSVAALPELELDFFRILFERREK